MTDRGPETDDRPPADVVTGMVDQVLHLAAIWPWRDGHTIEMPVDGEPPRIYTLLSISRGSSGAVRAVPSR